MSTANNRLRRPICLHRRTATPVFGPSTAAVFRVGRSFAGKAMMKVTMKKQEGNRP